MLEVSSHLPDLLCSGVIHHVEEPVEIVQEMQDVVTHFMRPTLEICRFDAFTNPTGDTLRIQSGCRTCRSSRSVPLLEDESTLLSSREVTCD